MDIEKEANETTQLVDTTIKEIELKVKDMYINDLEIKDNLNSIKKLENENNFLKDLLIDKKSELNLLKQLLILKERKKLNFEDIISKYLDQFILINNKINKKIDKLRQDNFIINKKQKIINKLFDNINLEFNNYLYKDNKKKLDTDTLKEKISEKMNKSKNKNYNIVNVFSNGNNKEICMEFNLCQKQNISNGSINDQKKFLNLDNIEIKIKNEDIKKLDKYKIYLNNKNLLNKNNNKSQIINEKKLERTKNSSKKALHNSFDNKVKNINLEINKNDIKKEHSSTNNNEKNKKNDRTYNYKIEKYNLKANKNLQNSRENLKYLLLKKESEKLNQKKNLVYVKYSKLLLTTINQYNKNKKRYYFNELLKYNSVQKLKFLFDKKYAKDLPNSIIEIIRKVSVVYNQNICEEIINENIFLNELFTKNIFQSKKKYTIEDYTKNLNEIKKINGEMKEIEGQVEEFINKITKNK